MKEEQIQTLHPLADKINKQISLITAACVFDQRHSIHTQNTNASRTPSYADMQCQQCSLAYLYS